jgi:hypothetical protein
MFDVGFGAVEGALAWTYTVPTKAVGAFRGRLANLQKQGLLGPRNMPGKGVVLRYGPDQVHRLVFACEALEFGIAPSVILALVRERWESRLREIFKDAEKAAERNPGPDDIILHMGGVRLMTDGWSDAVPNVNRCRLGKLPDYIDQWMRMGPDDPAGLPPRALVVNLSGRLRAFHRALAASHMTAPRDERAGSKGTVKGARKTK